MEQVVLENIWKFVFILSITGFLYFLNKYIIRIEKTLEKLTDGLEDIRQLVKLHEHRLNGHDEDFREVKNLKVKYTK
jgi:hypothetical protein